MNEDGVILAGDIGGTKTLLALFSCEGVSVVPIDERSFPSQHYADLEEAIDAFLRGRKVSPQRACFGVAGPVAHGQCETTNLPWVVDAQRISRRFEIPSVILLNDLEATAYGTLGLTEDECGTLNPGHADLQGNRAIIAAGTGLGESILFWDGVRHRPSASEGGHSDFAPRNPLEIELLEYLLRRHPHVSYERILSGPGLLNIYHFLKDTDRGKEPPWLAERLARENPDAVISELALSRKAALCVKALALFVSVYGAEAGNLALKAQATGGIYVGGGIAPKIVDGLLDGTFMKAFVDKGRFSSWLNRIPVRVILNEKTALQGATRYACQPWEQTL